MSDKLPCDVLVQPHTLIKAGCSVNTLMECIEMRRKRYEKGPPLPNIISRTQADEIQSLRQRVERLEGELDLAWEHLTLVLSCDPGPKLLAAREDASRWAMAYDKAKEEALGGHSEQS